MRSLPARSTRFSWLLVLLVTSRHITSHHMHIIVQVDAASRRDVQVTHAVGVVCMSHTTTNGSAGYVETYVDPSDSSCSSVRMKMQCDRELCSFMSVRDVVRARAPICAMRSTSCIAMWGQRHGLVRRLQR
jgi:hypothetical protein